MSISYRGATLIAIIVVLASCKRDKIDFGMIDDLSVNPEMEAPFVKARLSLNDVVVRDSGKTLTVDPDNSLRIKFLQDEIFSFSALDFVEIPTQDPIEFPLAVGMPRTEMDMSMGTIGGVELYETVLSDGFVRFTLEADSPFSSAVDVEVTFKNASLQQQVVVHTLTLPAGSVSIVDSLDISGSEWDFSNAGQGANYIGLAVEVMADPLLTGEMLDMSLQFMDLTVENCRGYFGQRQINIPMGSFDFDISGMENLFDGLYLEEPSIKLITSSSVGVGLELSPTLSGVNTAGKITPLGATPQTINSAEDVNSVRVDTLTFDPSNSQITDFLAALPTEVLYSGQAVMNANGQTDTNFINRESKVAVGVEVDVPLVVRMDNMRLRQEIDGINLFDENPDQLESLTLIFYTSNGFPFNLDVSVAFLDAAAPHDSIHGFELDLLSAATVDSEGRIVTRGEPAPQTVKLDGDIAAKLKQADKIRFTARISTEQDGQKAEKFFTNFDLEIKVAAKVKLNMKVNDL